MNKLPVRFENAAGQTLKGVILEPSSGESRSDVAVVYVTGTVLGATAVHGLAFKVAESLADLGVTTAVIDPPGVGESEGDYPSGTNEEISDLVAGGGFIGATGEIVDWVRDRLGIERVALIGHCGGALTAAYTTAENSSVAGALLISPPPMRRDKESNAMERPEVADEYFKLYSHNVFSPRRWRRLMTGETDYRTLLSVLSSKVRGKLGRSGADAESLEKDDDRFNQRLVQATARSLEDDKRLSVVFGDKDPDMRNFGIFYGLHMDDRVPLVVIEETSHGFTTAEGQLRLREEASAFIQRIIS